MFCFSSRDKNISSLISSVQVLHVHVFTSPKLFYRILSEREEKLMDLEMSCQRLADNSVDKEALLDSMQSDKTALSRAIAQNKELKTQLTELQNGFVKMVRFCWNYNFTFKITLFSCNNTFSRILFVS